MDALTITIIIALVCAIILNEINKRESAKVTSFFNRNNIALLIDADRKVNSIMRAMEMDYDAGERLAEQLFYLTKQYEKNEITLTDYHAGLDGLMGHSIHEISVNH